MHCRSGLLDTWYKGSTVGSNACSMMTLLYTGAYTRGLYKEYTADSVPIPPLFYYNIIVFILSDRRERR